MVCKKEAKTAALLSAAVIILISLIYVPDWTVIGVAKDSNLATRFVYSFFHTSIIHALINIWCFLSIMFLYDLSMWRLIIAYLVAVAVPEFVLTDVPTVGLSCICYFLLGSLIFDVKHKINFTICIVSYIAIGFLFQSVNPLIHLYGYLAGLLVGLLNAPISCFHLKK